MANTDKFHTIQIQLKLVAAHHNYQCCCSLYDYLIFVLVDGVVSEMVIVFCRSSYSKSVFMAYSHGCTVER